MPVLPPPHRSAPGDATARPAASVRVWDPLVRVLHGALVAAVALAWATGDELDLVHTGLGEAVAVLVAVRVAWGFIGPRRARFASFVRGPAAVLRYARGAVAGRAPRHLGHNPLGGWMIVALLATLLAVAGSGWLMTQDAFSGSEWLEELHEVLAHGLLVLVALHVAGAVLTGWQHGENLVKAMVSGRKRAPAADDVA
jgi:cytochrome b